MIDAISHFESEKIGFRNKLTQIGNRIDFETNQQNVHTPWELSKDMITQLSTSVNILDKTICVLNLEFVEVLCYDFKVNPEHIYFITDCKQKANVMKHPRYKGVNVVETDYLYMKIENNMKFDVICGNPPYQNGSGNKGSNNTLWDKFVKKSLELVKENGYLCMVHPSGWRAVGGRKNVGELLKSKQMLYLEIHDEKDGRKIFGVSSRYDWYVLCNKPNSNPTKIKDQTGYTYESDISKMTFIPNYGVDIIAPLLATNLADRIEIIKNCAYHSHNFNHNGEIKISREQTAKHKYPCVYSVNRKNEPKFLWSSFNNNGHFGIPKVIFGSGSTGFFIDINGDYGQTQFARSIVDSPEHLPKIAEALNSEKFKNVIKIMSVGASEINVEILKCFRKDFWKQFID